mmetsp:Transcript_41656/g.37053  ORF Transcript_41656/g.37053 Transcript_41656/m.37053 type:complete len:211 (+) Transcript_41656:437-1069(+)
MISWDFLLSINCSLKLVSDRKMVKTIKVWTMLNWMLNSTPLPELKEKSELVTSITKRVNSASMAMSTLTKTEFSSSTNWSDILMSSLPKSKPKTKALSRMKPPSVWLSSNSEMKSKERTTSSNYKSNNGKPILSSSKPSLRRTNLLTNNVSANKLPLKPTSTVLRQNTVKLPSPTMTVATRWPTLLPLLKKLLRSTPTRSLQPVANIRKE